jgi:hypothetical protein
VLGGVGRKLVQDHAERHRQIGRQRHQLAADARARRIVGH